VSFLFRFHAPVRSHSRPSQLLVVAVLVVGLFLVVEDLVVEVEITYPRVRFVSISCTRTLSYPSLPASSRGDPLREVIPGRGRSGRGGGDNISSSEFCFDFMLPYAPISVLLSFRS
jgi:hypothetical protein